MRLVRSDAELQPGLDGARREAQSAFGDGTLMLERLIDHGRHIEIQVFADAHGNAVHLGERDCTAQRRRQKVIEEAPSPVVSPAMREAMGRDAVAAALAVGYRGAGTVEFIVDAEFKHYFLEMNTRLQVEHPVTEMVTGLDLVEWQLRVAAGEPLPLQQSEIALTGHAIEVRLYAEDPYSGFTPQTGQVLWWQPGRAAHGGALGGGSGVRIDDGIVEGGEVSPFYDPMVAKVMAHGRDREDAIRRLRAALVQTPLLGLRNNGKFLRDLLDAPEFRSAQMTTSMLDQWQADGVPLLQAPQLDDDIWALAALAFVARTGSAWHVSSVAAHDLTLCCGTDRRTLRIKPGTGGGVVIGQDTESQNYQIDSFVDGVLRYQKSSCSRSVIAVFEANTLHLAREGHGWMLTEASAFPDAGLLVDASRARAPVAGKVTQVLVAVGDTVEPGQQLLCVEAMKMEMWLTAQATGTVAAIHTQANDQVEAAALLVELNLATTKKDT
jgi:geranyl-CoA carboxylase alpha subunit